MDTSGTLLADVLPRTTFQPTGAGRRVIVVCSPEAQPDCPGRETGYTAYPPGRRTRSRHAVRHQPRLPRCHAAAAADGPARRCQARDPRGGSAAFPALQPGWHHAHRHRRLRPLAQRVRAALRPWRLALPLHHRCALRAGQGHREPVLPQPPGAGRGQDHGPAQQSLHACQSSADPLRPGIDGDGQPGGARRAAAARRQPAARS